MFVTRPMKVIARGPGCRSLISHSAYSTAGCHGSIGFGFRASSISSAVKPSPIGASKLGKEDVVVLVREAVGVGEKKA